MRSTTIHATSFLFLALAGGCSAVGEGDQVETAGDRLSTAQSQTFETVNGSSQTYSSTGSLDTNNPFFQAFGTNGRSCGTCHHADEGWTITPSGVQARFEASGGTDPLFKPHDAATSPRADVSTVEARREAYKLLLSRGLVRIGIGVNPASEFELAAVDDPYGFASSAQLSLFRRPMPTANLAFIASVSWDARLTLPGKTIFEDLAEQANRATKGHGQATTDLTLEQRNAIAAFEMSTFTARRSVANAGPLDKDGALGGAENLANRAFELADTYAAWNDAGDGSAKARARSAIARGAKLFGEARLHRADGASFSCASCHNVASAGGNRVTALTFDIGVSDASRRSPDVPLYTFRNKTTGETRQLTDPGRSLITGKWADLGKFKAPNLRDLAPRPPYFHDGSAATLADVVDHYRARFRADVSDAERDDLVAFLDAL